MADFPRQKFLQRPGSRLSWATLRYGSGVYTRVAGISVEVTWESDLKGYGVRLDGKRHVGSFPNETDAMDHAERLLKDKVRALAKALGLPDAEGVERERKAGLRAARAAAEDRLPPSEAKFFTDEILQRLHARTEEGK